MKDSLPKQKVPFTVDSLQKQAFSRNVQLWTADLDIELFVHDHYFKYFPRFITQIEKNIISNTIKYVIFKRFPPLFQQNCQQQLLNLSSQIKKSYVLLNIKKLSKKDAYFHCLCIFLTKTVAAFLKNTLIDVDIDKDLQSEFYVILVFVIIGLEVAPKAYMVNLKKIVFLKQFHFSKTKSLCRLETVETTHDKSESRKFLALKGPRKFGVVRKFTNMSFNQEKKDPLTQFKQILHQNLAVKPLPKLIKKKAKGCDFDYNAQKRSAEIKGDENRYKFMKQVNQSQKPSQKYIHSKQNSTSFEYMLNKSGEKQFVHSSIKISHRPQLILRKKTAERQIFFKNVNLTHCSKEHSVDQNQSKNWDKVIKNVRQNVVQSFKSRKQDSDKSIDYSQQLLRQRKMINIERGTAKTHHSTSPNSNRNDTYLINKPTSFGTQWIHCLPKTQEQNSKKQNIRALHSTIIRRKRHQFDRSCQKRNHEAHSSIFNLSTKISSYHI